MALIMINILIF